VVDKPEQTQSQVRIGTVTYPRSSPNFFPGIGFNAALGAGFTSRLMTEIRVKRGLSYGVGSRFDSLKLGGSFSISTFTKTATTEQIIDVALAQVAALRDRGFKAGELQSSVKYVAGIYPLRTESNDAFANMLSGADLYELGRDWVEKYRERILSVRAPEAQAVAKTFLKDDAFNLVVVGNAKEVVKQVVNFGKVRVVKAAELV